MLLGLQSGGGGAYWRRHLRRIVAGVVRFGGDEGGMRAQIRHMHKPWAVWLFGKVREDCIGQKGRIPVGRGVHRRGKRRAAEGWSICT
jgi:hypothetical protein